MKTHHLAVTSVVCEMYVLQGFKTNPTKNGSVTPPGMFKNGLRIHRRDMPCESKNPQTTEPSGHPDSAAQIQNAISQQGTLLGSHEIVIQDLNFQLSLQSTTISHLNLHVFELTSKVNITDIRGTTFLIYFLLPSCCVTST